MCTPELKRKTNNYYNSKFMNEHNKKKKNKYILKIERKKCNGYFLYVCFFKLVLMKIRCFIVLL